MRVILPPLLQTKYTTLPKMQLSPSVASTAAASVSRNSPIFMDVQRKIPGGM